MTDEIKGYWDRAHADKNIAALTGNRLRYHLDALQAHALLRADAKALCIGVGTGDWIFELAEALDRGLIVAVDISDVARELVARRVAATFSPDAFFRLAPRDCFDIALSLWVAPHMRSAELQRQMQAVVPSLTETGIFAVHYNEPYPGTSFDEEGFVARCSSEAEALSSGLMRVTAEKFAAIVSQAGGEIVRRFVYHPAPDYDENCCVAHIRRRR
jgi:hypothetical protein